MMCRCVINISLVAFGSKGINIKLLAKKKNKHKNLNLCCYENHLFVLKLKKVKINNNFEIIK